MYLFYNLMILSNSILVSVWTLEAAISEAMPQTLLSQHTNTTNVQFTAQVSENNPIIIKYLCV